MKKSNKKGFTIVELVIVIAVIAILAAVLIPTFSGLVEKANKNAALQEAKNALTLALADQKDASLDGAKITVDGKYSFSYNGSELTADADYVAPPTTEYHSNNTYVSASVVVFIGCDDFVELVDGAATYTAVGTAKATTPAHTH